ncbi:MAG: DNA-3-methyladenine glycosylase I [Bacteroidetes bacterium]|nr:MAG: DNA-3-methyladenine glycosylase I [Bacteroidota bacterium]
MKQIPTSPATCEWPSGDQLMIEYHDLEWGVPVHNDRKHFEFILLDCFQAGLSWKTVLHKRNNFKKAFDHFDFRKIAKYGPEKTEALLQDAGIIRNKAKIYATIRNANCFLEIQKEFGSFDAYIWQFTSGKTLHNKWKKLSELPVTSKESDAMSKDLIKRGFKFAGSTICYSYMQAAGMVNDHLVHCSRYRELKMKNEE